MYTNKCNDGVGFFVLPPAELMHRQDLWYSGPRACNVRARVRVINADGHNAHWSAWAYSNKSTDVVLEWDARIWCFSQYEVRRYDGTWFNNYHYSQAFHDSLTRRQICTDA